MFLAHATIIDSHKRGELSLMSCLSRLLLWPLFASIVLVGCESDNAETSPINSINTEKCTPSSRVYIPFTSSSSGGEFRTLDDPNCSKSEDISQTPFIVEAISVLHDGLCFETIDSQIPDFQEPIPLLKDCSSRELVWHISALTFHFRTNILKEDTPLSSRSSRMIELDWNSKKVKVGRIFYRHDKQLSAVCFVRTEDSELKQMIIEKCARALDE